MPVHASPRPRRSAPARATSRPRAPQPRQAPEWRGIPGDRWSLLLVATYATAVAAGGLALLR